MEPEKISKFEKYANLYNKDAFNTLNEEMSFEEYVEKLYQKPRLCRNSFQYILDMILAPGTEEFERYRTTYVKYKFFSEDKISPIFGLEETLDALVNFIHGAAGGFGTEKRVCLLHGPVGSSKSTICRIIKRGLESYSKTDDGAWYTYRWVNLPTTGENFVYTNPTDECPMHQDPIKLMSVEMRSKLIKDLNLILKQQIEDEKSVLKEGEKYNKGIYELECKGGLNPRCRLFMNMLLKQYNGDWGEVVKNHIRVVRKCHSEIDRIGIGTFQPKDAKNQDSTELTGDMNFGKIGQFGADSDPRAFNFDGEFEVAERGVLEFIEALKLDNEFLYDLLGATQEHQVKPKKFSQVEIDEFILAHSVHGDTPVPHEYNGVLDVLPISELANLEVGKLRVFSVNQDTGNVELTPVKNVFSHDFEGDWIDNQQDGESVLTTENHSLYKWNGDNLETFYPSEDEFSDIATFKIPLDLVLNFSKTDRWNLFFAKQNTPEYV